MNKPLLTKLAVIAGIAFLLNIPLMMIKSKASERQSYRWSAIHNIASSWTGSQKLLGPFIRLPYSVKEEKQVWDDKLKSYQTRRSTLNKERWLLADTVVLDVRATNDIRYKGIYEIPVYSSSIEVTGVLPKGIVEAARQVPNLSSVGIPTLSFVISDSRGITNIPRLRAGGLELDFQSGSDLKFNPNGIHIAIPDKLSREGGRFSLSMGLQGMQEQSFFPIAREATVTMQSDWLHPSFIGSFLPASRVIDETGYRATWKVTSFATNIESKVKECEKGNCDVVTNSTFGVMNIDPVDVYLQLDRSIKYGFLFIALTFVTFFGFEIFKRLSVHGVQYTLVGLAVATFYLLLLALSEHISFFYSYIIATAACVALIHVYLASVLKSQKTAFGFSCGFVLLYSLLYYIIQAEDVALLMGAILTFAVLAAVMISTRKVDWLEAGQKLGWKKEDGVETT